MPSNPEIVPVTDLRKDADAVVKRVRVSRDPVVITQRGRAAAVLISVESYERGERERQLLRMLVRGEGERQLLRMLARGEQEIAAGVVGHVLDDVLGEADVLLDESA